MVGWWRRLWRFCVWRQRRCRAWLAAVLTARLAIPAMVTRTTVLTATVLPSAAFRLALARRSLRQWAPQWLQRSPRLARTWRPAATCPRLVLWVLPQAVRSI